MKTKEKALVTDIIVSLTDEQADIINKYGKNECSFKEVYDALDENQHRLINKLMSIKTERRSLAYWVGQITSIVVLLCILTLICGLAVFVTLKLLGWMFPYLGAKMLFW